MDALPSDSREPLRRTLRKHALPLIAGQLKTLWTKASGLASPRKEMPKSTKAVLVVNGPDDLPPSIVGRPSRETFPESWIQSPKTFGTIEGKECDRQENLFTQGSNEYPESRKTRETDSSPIQESVDDSNKEIERQELARTIEPGVEIMPDDPQVATSHATAMARIATMLNSNGTNLSLTTGATKTAPNQPTSSYWIQDTEVFGTNIEFINNRWYSIIWSKSFNSHYAEKDQYDEESGLLGLGSLARLLQTQETVEGKKRDRRESLSTKESSKCPASKETREGDSSSIQRSISDSNEESRRQKLTKSLELNIGITPTPDNPQTAKRSENGQTGSTSFGQRAPAQHTTGQTGLGPSWGPTSASTGGSLSGGLQTIQQQQLVQQQRPQMPPILATPPGGQPPQGPPGGPPGGPPQAAAPQQAVQAPHGTDGA